MAVKLPELSVMLPQYTLGEPHGAVDVADRKLVVEVTAVLVELGKEEIVIAPSIATRTTDELLQLLFPSYIQP